MTHANGALNSTFEASPGSLKITPYSVLPSLYLSHDDAEVRPGGDWYKRPEPLAHEQPSRIAIEKGKIAQRGNLMLRKTREALARLRITVAPNHTHAESGSRPGIPRV